MAIREFALLKTFLDMLYPVRCPVCGNIVIPKDRNICTQCEDKLQFISEPRCKKCSKPIDDEQKEYCIDCEKREYHYEQGFSVWIYDSAIKKAIMDFKYRHKKEYAKYFTQAVVERYGNKILYLAPDALVPVPLHKSKYRERGYNQAEILARSIGKELNIPVLPDLLVRNKKTLPQKQLSDKERLKNLREAFEINKAYDENKISKLNRLMLVDDIYTTGSTIEACASVLKQKGISCVYFITLCTGKGF
ncbi:ComF family protein [Herbinix hemicellulosilytica]|uniref:ComF family protein n=1 Tax=Herbinix hemicellulosilytica TaxID=1564487 RepID=UPI000CD2D788|nr:ComF family protein [Herbinix hemicellulosilytica]